MLPIEQNEKFSFMGEVTRPVFSKQNRFFIEFKVIEFNNRRIRPELLLVCVTNRQQSQLSRVSEGDSLYVTAEGTNNYENQNVNAINFAYLLDYRLLYTNDNSDRNDFHNYINNLKRGRFNRF